MKKHIYLYYASPFILGMLLFFGQLAFEKWVNNDVIEVTIDGEPLLADSIMNIYKPKGMLGYLNILTVKNKCAKNIHGVGIAIGCRTTSFCHAFQCPSIQSSLGMCALQLEDSALAIILNGLGRSAEVRFAVFTERVLDPHALILETNGDAKMVNGSMKNFNWLQFAKWSGIVGMLIGIAVFFRQKYYSKKGRVFSAADGKKIEEMWRSMDDVDE